jgi:hypothetical protein
MRDVFKGWRKEEPMLDVAGSDLKNQVPGFDWEEMRYDDHG